MNKDERKAEEYTHFRLCHACLYLNEAPHEIVQCKRCHRFLTTEPFSGKTLRNLSVSDEEIASDDPILEESHLQKGQSRDVPSLNGLKVLW